MAWVKAATSFGAIVFLVFLDLDLNNVAVGIQGCNLIMKAYAD
jgi:hypothetical protein